MIKKSSLRILQIITGFLILLTGSAFIGYYPGGSPGGYSGSPLDGKNCIYCHGGIATTQEGIITSNIDTSGYVPGSDYTITVSVPGSGLKGFEVSPLNSSNLKAGILTSGTDSKLTNSSKAVTQSITSGSNPAIWTFKWTAPASGIGIVTFYGAFTAGKTQTLLSSMIVKEKKMVSIATDILTQLLVRYESTSKKLYFKSYMTIPQQFSAKLYSIDGKEVLRIAENDLISDQNIWESDLTGLKSPGIYILKYSFGNKITSKKIFF